MWLVGLLITVVSLTMLHYGAPSLRRKRAAVANLPGPYCMPVLGLITLVLACNSKNLFKLFERYYAKHGNILRIWIFNRLGIVSADIELNEQMFISQQHISKQRNYSLLMPWLGCGLLLSDGSKWFARRKIITPTFHFKILEQFVEVFDQQTTTLVQRLARYADGRTAFDVNRFVSAATLDIIAETAMGTKVYAQTDEETPYVYAVRKMTKFVFQRILRVYYHNELIFKIFCPRQSLEQRRLIGIMHSFTHQIIMNRRRVLEQTQDANVELAEEIQDNVVGAKKRMALLDVLLHSTIDGQPLSDEDIREEVETFMFEGHDTTASAISFSLLEISRHPEVQQRLLDEVHQVLGSDERRQLTMRDLNELKYTECVIKETLRLYPSVPLIAREIHQDFKYRHSRLGEGVIPADTEFLIDIFSMMRNPAHWPDPNDFRPERHENDEKLVAFMLVPFSAGPRNCIGQKFAMLEMKATLAKVVRDFELLPLGEDPELDINMILHSANGWQLGMRPRL